MKGPGQAMCSGRLCHKGLFLPSVLLFATRGIGLFACASAIFVILVAAALRRYISNLL